MSPAEAPFHGIARLVPFGIVRLGVRAPLPGGNDGLEALRLSPRAKGVAVIGPVGDQAGPRRRARPGFHQSLGAVVALAARHAQVQGTAPAIRQDVDLGAEAAPAATEGGIRPYGFGARPPRSRPCCLAPRGQIQSGRR